MDEDGDDGTADIVIKVVLGSVLVLDMNVEDFTETAESLTFSESNSPCLPWSLMISLSGDVGVADVADVADSLLILDVNVDVFTEEMFEPEGSEE